MEGEQAKWAKSEGYPSQARPSTAGPKEQVAGQDEASDGRLAPAAGMVLGLLLGALFWGCVITAIIFLG